jgi:hypothetical protein
MNRSEDFADVEIFIRPADENTRGDRERFWQGTYHDVAKLSTRSIVNNVADTFDLSAGYWRVGIRERGDEQYQQRFRVAEPHAEAHGDDLLRNHLLGVLNHWRA